MNYVTQLCTVGARLSISKFALMNQIHLQGDTLFKDIRLCVCVCVCIQAAYIQVPCDCALVDQFLE